MQATTTLRRGLRLHQAIIFEELEIRIPESTDQRNGRNPQLIEKRDHLLMHRYYFKAKIQRKLYDDVYNELEGEFFLSRTMLAKIIQAKADQALLIKKQQPTKSDLQKQFPFMVWL